MCTAITYKTKDFYFGRNLDYEKSFGEKVVITPRNYIYSFRHVSDIKHHYAMIGVACIYNNYPLYYDAVNEKGLCVAGLNYVGNAVYKPHIRDNINGNNIKNSKVSIENNVDEIASFEFIPWILSRCVSVKEARVLLDRICIVDTQFSDTLPNAMLHWIMADKDECIVIECDKDGMHIYDNEVGVLTNNPSFKEQMFNLNNYMMLSPKEPMNLFSSKLSFNIYSRGMGAIGLPGDVSSQSRFVRATFNKMNLKSGVGEKESVASFFHILDSVKQIKGCNEITEGVYEITLYSSCCNVSKGIYYYKTYEGLDVKSVDMYKENLDGGEIIAYEIFYLENTKR